jgi:hypothetical protein
VQEGVIFGVWLALGNKCVMQVPFRTMLLHSWGATRNSYKLQICL